MTSKGEDVQAYTRLLKFQKKRYGVGFNDLVLLLFSLIFMIGNSIIMIKYASGGGRTFIFIIAAFFSILLIITFFDYAFNLGLFHENGLYYSSAVILIAVIISIILSVGTNTLFPDSNRNELIALLGLITMLTCAGIISYFITTATPTREGKEEIIQKLSQIRKEIKEIPVAELGSVSAVERALKWIQYQQRQDGIWGENNPLYETAEVLRMFTSMKKGMKYTWKSVVNGVEESHTIEQIYYLILDALDTALIELNNELLIPVLGIVEIDNQHIDIGSEVFAEFKDSLLRFSEWEFIKEIERFDENSDRIEELPIIFTISQVFLLKNEFEVAQICADIFANTFGILINRAAARFNVSTEKEISNLILGKMYNTLISLVRSKEESFFSLDVTDEVNLESFTLPDMEDTDTSVAMPDMDFDFNQKPEVEEDLGFSIPDIDDVSDNDSSSTRIKIGTSLASIRNYIRSKQSIDGSWSGNIEFTAECLLAVSDQESVENEFIKSAVHYLLALQEKNGSWQNNIVLTAKIAKALDKINAKINLGGF